MQLKPILFKQQTAHHNQQQRQQHKQPYINTKQVDEYSCTDNRNAHDQSLNGREVRRPLQDCNSSTTISTIESNRPLPFSRLHMNDRYFMSAERPPAK